MPIAKGGIVYLSNEDLDDIGCVSFPSDNIESISPERFLDFQEPVLINKNK